jgi:hypothetical protein
MDFKFTPHAIEKLQERGIPLQVVMTVLLNPERVTSERNERSAYEGEVSINGKPYILRVIVEADGEVVTLYRTSKVEKYGGEQ